MKVLVIGSGAREHAICSRLIEDGVSQVLCEPGNQGMSPLLASPSMGISADSPLALAEYAKDQKVDFTIVGPEAPLAKGIVDYFEAKDLRIVAPDQMAARLETSKIFAKEFMGRHGVPTAKFAICENRKEARRCVEAVFGAPVVIKADRLAVGKGVVVAETVEEAFLAIDHLALKYGPRMVVEERLRGYEVSFTVLTDADTGIVVLPVSQDHKRLLAGDRGPNTGGMGAYSTEQILTPVLKEMIMDRIVLPVISGMRLEGWPYRGFLYVGLMITDEGPKVLEFNCRLGDPEAQAILPRLARGEFTNAVRAVSERRLGLDKLELTCQHAASLAVVLATRGYPGDEYKKHTGYRIAGLEEACDEGCHIFHAGTSKGSDGCFLNSGGRVLGVSAVGRNIREAQYKAYRGTRRIHFNGMHYRPDIGDKALLMVRAG